MRTGSRLRFVVLAGATLVFLALAAAPAAATITPQGACTGTGIFTPEGEGSNPRSADAARITIPKKASVVWTGSVNITPAPTEPRATHGHVELKLPMGQKVTLGDWNTSGTQVSNSGTYTYDVPSVIAGFDMTFSGEHYEKGVLWCSGTVTVQVEGSNPLGIVSVALTVFSAVGAYLTIRPRAGGGQTAVTEYRKGEVI